MKRINILLLWAGCVVFMFTMCLAIFNMILRPMGHPIAGSFELMGLGCAVLTALGLGYSQETRSHISVDILFRHFPASVKRALNGAGSLITGLFFMAAAWRIFKMALAYREYGELSETLRLPFYPITMLVALGIFVLSLNLLSQAFSARGRRDGRKSAGSGAKGVGD